MYKGREAAQKEEEKDDSRGLPKEISWKPWGSCGVPTCVRDV